MGSKATSSSQIIALPKGGGAQKGLGEKLSSDLHTGTGNFTVPLALPSGRNGFQPQLNLVYSTGNGHSYFGLGWTLSIPGVMRKTARGIPRYSDYDKDVSKWDSWCSPMRKIWFPSKTSRLIRSEDAVSSPHRRLPYQDHPSPRSQGWNQQLGNVQQSWADQR